MGKSLGAVEVIAASLAIGAELLATCWRLSSLATVFLSATGGPQPPGPYRCRGAVRASGRGEASGRGVEG